MTNKKIWKSIFLSGSISIVLWALVFYALLSFDFSRAQGLAIILIVAMIAMLIHLAIALRLE